ncbi:MAG: RusA family crossover junction endodeoxyribonuclease [Methanobacterium sp.]
MKTISFYFPFKPLSLNAAYKTLPNGRRAKSAKYTPFKKQVERIVDGKQLADFAATFDESKHSLKLTLIVYLKDFYTKNGRISKTSLDIFNAEKVTMDIISKVSGINDAFITEGHVTKNQGDKDCFFLNLEINNK